MAKDALTLAQQDMRRRHFATAIKRLEVRADIYHGNFEYYLTLGIACLYVGDVGAASSYFQMARRIKLTDTRLLLGQAAIFLRRGDTARALQYYLEIKDLDPLNKTAEQAIEFIRVHGNYDTICRWVDTGRIEQFYPPIGVNPDKIMALVLPVLACLVGVVVAVTICTSTAPSCAAVSVAKWHYVTFAQKTIFFCKHFYLLAPVKLFNNPLPLCFFCKDLTFYKKTSCMAGFFSNQLKYDAQNLVLSDFFIMPYNLYHLFAFLFLFLCFGGCRRFGLFILLVRLNQRQNGQFFGAFWCNVYDRTRWNVSQIVFLINKIFYNLIFCHFLLLLFFFFAQLKTSGKILKKPLVYRCALYKMKHANCIFQRKAFRPAQPKIPLIGQSFCN